MAKHESASDNVYSLPLSVTHKYTVHLPGKSKQDIHVLVEDLDMYVDVDDECPPLRVHQHYVLPEGTDIERVTARFENNVLTIRLDPSKSRVVEVQ